MGAVEGSSARPRRARSETVAVPCIYNEYFGFKEPPFSITPNPRFLFFSTKHTEALNHMLFGITEGKGFIQLTGEVGSGKTTLCRALLDRLGDKYKTAMILNPCLTVTQLLKTVIDELGLKAPSQDRIDLLNTLNAYLLSQMARKQRVVLIIDEAQDMSLDLLEQVRLLSNLETDEEKLLQIVLIGQPELRARLDDHRLRQLRQRITIRFHLHSLSKDEAEYYIHHRVQVSGGNGVPRFNRGALRGIYRYSNGVPRLINAVCDKTLLCGYVAGTNQLTSRHVKRAVRELEGQFS
jgi:general secretion pathway protein A